MRGLMIFAALTGGVLVSCSAKAPATRSAPVRTAANVTSAAPANAPAAGNDEDRFADYYAAAKVAAADFIIAHPDASDTAVAASATAAARSAGDPDAKSTAGDAISEAREWVALRKANGFPPMAAPGELAENDAGDPDGPPSRGVHYFPKIGACFETQVATKGTRLENVSDSGDLVTYADGHLQMSYDTSPAVRAFHVGDRVRLCVTALPGHCPPADDRGIAYAALDLKTGGRWEATDSEHMCGGA